MRLGVLDVGSNTVHLLVVDAHPGARPWPAHSHKEELRLAEHLGADGSIDRSGADDLVRFVRSAYEQAEDRGVEETLAFATSAIREAPNGQSVLDRVAAETGVALQVLSGADESRLTFLAVRRWYGWSAGRLLDLDIGGGSLEIATGQDEVPDVAVSLPLGAGRLTRDRLRHDPPDADELRSLRKHVRSEIAREVRPIAMAGTPDRVVGTSKTFRSLARLAGAAPSGEGQFVARTLLLEDLRGIVRRLSTMPVGKRGALPGVSAGRSAQVLAGAIVAEAAMDLLGVEKLDICPWALREGLILRRLGALGA